ncbi:MAG: M1 family peptidase [Desulfobacteraceae bacterium]|nr:MAG: M1 family peptidase [Desulfobacteraceae bacterium]
MADIKPLHYRLHLEPDLARLRFGGRVEIELEPSAPVQTISMNSLELAIWECRVGSGKDETKCAFSVDPLKESVTIHLPSAMGGKIILKIDYEGLINNKMAGFYRTRYVHQGVEKIAAVTQFEENDARRAFPCFDHPSKKAAFDVEIAIDGGLTAISNNPVEEEIALEGGRKLVRFQTTPIMSTYLLFFGVGEFDFIEAPGEVLIRLAAAPGMAKYGDFALEFSRKALSYSEEYYGIRYPLPKLDLIAVSDFSAGAMENWGAMTFRENLLLRDPEKTSKAGEERICEVIAHEIAHQWFGDLVTPREWEYLWLNESFATYFGFGVVNHYYPEWDMWGRFLNNSTNVAFERDGLTRTIPIEIPGGGHVLINVSTAPIIYSKGGSILRQIEGYVGSESFRDGLRDYLGRHAYGTATSNDLWESFEKASAKPVSTMIRNWISQPGYPILEVERNKNALKLRQERFTFLPGTFEGEWMIPLTVKLFLRGGTEETVNALMEKSDLTIPLREDVVAYLVNSGQTGFYRVRYKERENLQALGKRVSEKALASEERWGLQNDLYALVKRGDADSSVYLSFLEFYREEDAFLPLVSISDHLHHLFLVSGQEGRKGAASFGKGLFDRVLSRIGYSPVAGEPHATSILREHLLWHAALYGSREALSFGGRGFDTLLKGGQVHPDIMRTTMQIAALAGGNETLEWLEKAFTTSENEHERLNILMAMGCFRDEDIIRKALQFLLDRVPDRNKFVVIGSLAANPDAQNLLWDWYLSSISRLEPLHPVHYERFIAAIVPWGGLGREEEVKRFFDDYKASHERFRDAIGISLERLEIHSRMRRRTGT